MDDDELTPDEFRSKMAAGEPATIEGGPRPTLFRQPDPAYRITFGVGNGVSSTPGTAHWVSGPVPARAR